MPRTARALLALAALASCAPDLDAPAARGRDVRAAAAVRVVTWNVHDLFDEVDRQLPPGDLDTVPPAEEVEAKISAVAAVLARLDADVVLLQEVENRVVLARVAAAAGYPEARLVEGRDPRGIDVAALSRLPVEAYVSHLGETDAAGRPLWPRDCVELHARAAGRPLVLVGSHLSSALSDDGTRRTVQAARLRAIADGVRAARPGALVLAGGDLNDEPESAPLAPLLGDGAWVDAGPAGVATWLGRTGSARLDYLLVPRVELAALVSVGIAAGPDVSAASDHRPVVADLLLE
jgi:endonuclease/exonuclease/phosphatase family metal-dependent hydrolase